MSIVTLRNTFHSILLYSQTVENIDERRRQDETRRRRGNERKRWFHLNPKGRLSFVFSFFSFSFLFFPLSIFSIQAPALVMQRQSKNHAKMMTAEEELHRRCAHRHSVRQNSGDVNLAHLGRGLKKQRRYSQRTIPMLLRKSRDKIQFTVLDPTSILHWACRQDGDEMESLMLESWWQHRVKTWQSK